ncbi:MAG: HAD family hydrolase [Bdellovibrionota bacterium]
MDKIAVLFDIDGTLVRTGGAGARALDRALDELHGIPDGMSRVKSAGRTDPLIVRDIFRAAKPGHPLKDEEVYRVLARYVEILAQELRDTDTFRVLPGLPDLLEDLHASGKAIVGLATGNVESGGKVKLSHGGLWKYFPFGGFATDAEDRSELTRIAVRRARESAGYEIPSERIFIVGDTPHDITAARASGVRVVAVATGPHESKDLHPHRPDFLLENLSDRRRFLEIVGL